MGVLLLALVALAVVLLLTTRPSSGEGEEFRTAQMPAPTTAPSPSVAALPPASPGPTPPPTPAPLHREVTVLEPNYTVQPGDTLGAIASRFDTTVEALLAYNKLERSSILHNGQRLFVPKEPQ